MRHLGEQSETTEQWDEALGKNLGLDGEKLLEMWDAKDAKGEREDNGYDLLCKPANGEGGLTGMRCANVE